VIPLATIGRLIEAGGSNNLGDPAWVASFSDLGACSAINTHGWQTWYPVTESLTDSEVECVIRALTHCEKEFHWLGGSVSAVIWTFKALENRGTTDVSALAEWVLRTSNNPWVPFGSDRGNARSLEEIRLANAARSARRLATKQAEDRRHENADASRLKRGNEHNAVRADHRSRWERLVGELEPLASGDRIRGLLHVEGSIAMSSFPESWASAISADDLATFSSAELATLVKRLASVDRGEWKALRRRMNELDLTAEFVRTDHGVPAE